MASETLVVPEESLRDVIRVIRAGLDHTKGIPRKVRQNLRNWCVEEEMYLDDCESDE